MPSPGPPAGRSRTRCACGMYISDMRHFDEMDAEYRRFFADPMPARTTIQSDLVGFDVEGDAVVWLGG